MSSTQYPAKNGFNININSSLEQSTFLSYAQYFKLRYLPYLPECTMQAP